MHKYTNKLLTLQIFDNLISQGGSITPVDPARSLSDGEHMVAFANLKREGSAVSLNVNFDFFAFTSGWAFGAWIRTNDPNATLVEIKSDSVHECIIALKDGKPAIRFCSFLGPFDAVASMAESVADGQWHYVGVAMQLRLDLNPLRIIKKVCFIRDDKPVAVHEHWEAPTPAQGETLQRVSAEGHLQSSLPMTVSFRGDVTGILFGPCPPLCDPNYGDSTGEAVNNWFDRYRRAAATDTDFKQDKTEAYCPFFSWVQDKQSYNLAKDTALSFSGAAAVDSTSETMLDAMTELVMYVKDGQPFPDVNSAAFTFIMQSALAPFRSWSLEKLRKSYRDIQDFTELRDIFQNAKYDRSAGCTEDQFDQTKTTIANELEGVISFQIYFSAAMNCHTVIGTEVKNCLESCKTLFGPLKPVPTPLTYSLSAIFDLVSFIPELAPEEKVAISIFKSIWTLGNVDFTRHALPDDSAHSIFTATYDALIDTVNDKFWGDAQYLATSSNLILSDGGRVTALAALVEQQKLAWPIAAFSFNDSMKIATTLSFVQPLLMATFSRYSSEATSPVDGLINFGVWVDIPKQFTTTYSYWDPIYNVQKYGYSVIGHAHDYGIDLAPTPELASFIFDQAKSDLWSWGWPNHIV